MKILNISNDIFYLDLKKILQKRFQHNLISVDDSVQCIIEDVIERGDLALFDYANKLDGHKLSVKIRQKVK